MRYLYLFVFLLTSLTLSCQSWQSVSVDAVNQAINANNVSVEALESIQNSARQSRAEVLKQIAKTAPSVEEGKRQMDVVDSKYEAVFETFRKAEKVQGTLASALETAKAAVEAGQIPDLSSVMKLYSSIQLLYKDVLALLAEV